MRLTFKMLLLLATFFTMSLAIADNFQTATNSDSAYSGLNGGNGGGNGASSSSATASSQASTTTGGTGGAAKLAVHALRVIGEIVLQERRA